MSNRSLYFLGAGVGGTVGGLLPNAWGASEFSAWGVVLSTIGGIIGIWVAYKFIKS